MEQQNKGLLAKIDSLSFRAKLATQSFIGREKFHLKTSREDAIRSKKEIDVFTEEFLGFLDENPMTALKPIQPSVGQLRVFDFLMDNLKTGNYFLRNDEGGYMVPSIIHICFVT